MKLHLFHLKKWSHQQTAALVFNSLLTVNILIFSILLLYVQYPEPVCTSLLFTLLFIKSQYTVFFFCTSYCFLHILLFCTFLFHCTFYSYFSFFTIYMLLCCVTLYNFFFYSSALSTERTWFDYISLLIIPCITYYVTNKETLNLTLRHHLQYHQQLTGGAVALLLAGPWVISFPVNVLLHSQSVARDIFSSVIRLSLNAYL